MSAARVLPSCSRCQRLRTKPGTDTGDQTRQGPPNIRDRPSVTGAAGRRHPAASGSSPKPASQADCSLAPPKLRWRKMMMMGKGAGDPRNKGRMWKVGVRVASSSPPGQAGS